MEKSCTLLIKTFFVTGSILFWSVINLIVFQNKLYTKNKWSFSGLKNSYFWYPSNWTKQCNGKHVLTMFHWIMSWIRCLNCCYCTVRRSLENSNYFGTGCVEIKPNRKWATKLTKWIFSNSKYMKINSKTAENIYLNIIYQNFNIVCNIQEILIYCCPPKTMWYVNNVKIWLESARITI